jgi:hypothetical protein
MVNRQIRNPELDNSACGGGIHHRGTETTEQNKKRDSQCPPCLRGEEPTRSQGSDDPAMQNKPSFRGASAESGGPIMQNKANLQEGGSRLEAGGNYSSDCAKQSQFILPGLQCAPSSERRLPYPGKGIEGSFRFEVSSVRCERPNVESSDFKLHTSHLTLQTNRLTASLRARPAVQNKAKLGQEGVSGLGGGIAYSAKLMSRLKLGPRRRATSQGGGDSAARRSHTLCRAGRRKDLHWGGDSGILCALLEGISGKGVFGPHIVRHTQGGKT